ncbi:MULTISPECIES: TfoX/Sxy family protein [Nocardiaceae]|uniref:TfoX/Sxy family transcriptional regulator of competence genes n=1 Tax=Rhodococcoides corynebacterioides TaxID=53972 RepID=A0ABS2KV90_9NOCA|nr:MULTISPECIES: TfoX/Sxy family protein [Rhodococcus]MBM7415862.1 TfoX/Sxy family transcriptional regulator of competence genes [Rhodococcus corynebacterioides]MBP1118324.1 TfoX/Sxy family transcriptional regulator of competence genes [Rhodococcus sp. PvP016]
MARDADLEDRVRAALSARSTVTEKAMFGGLAFMVDGKMVVSVGNGGGALLVRVPRERDDDYIGRPGARRAQMGAGRSMGPGWISVDAAALESDDDLQVWLDAATSAGTP